MYFLHSNPELAAASLCDADVLPTLHEALGALQVAVSGKSKFDCASSLVEWLDEDGFNYHWLAYFAECLSPRHPGYEFYSEIMSLRRSVPDKPGCRGQTPFPRLSDYKDEPIYSTSSKSSDWIIAEYRAAYLHSRHGSAEWRTANAPAWVFRLANTLLSPLDRQNFLLRVQPAGPSGADHERGRLAERKELRDGPVGSIDTGPAGQFNLW